MKSILAAVAALFVLTSSAEAHRVGVWIGPGVVVGVNPWGGGMYGWQGTSPPFFYGGPVWGGPVWHGPRRWHGGRHWNRGHWNGHRHHRR